MPIVRMPAATVILNHPKLRRFTLDVGGTGHHGSNLVGMIDERITARNHIFEIESWMTAPLLRRHRAYAKVADRIDCATLEQVPLTQSRIKPTLQALSRCSLWQQVDQKRW